MHTHAMGLAAAALTALAASPASSTISVKNMSGFAIKGSDMPAGCSVLKIYGKDAVSAVITCGTPEQYKLGFEISGKLQANCAPKADTYVCEVKESDN